MPSKTWSEKLHNSKDLPKIVILKPSGAKQWGGEKMVVPAPLEVNEIMSQVLRGKIITLNELRQKLANKHHADITCPLTSGIFSWIAAYAAEEERIAGKTKTTPYWRTLKSGGEVNPKYPGGLEVQKKLLESEGHKIIQRGKRYFVENYQKKLTS